MDQFLLHRLALNIELMDIWPLSVAFCEANSNVKVLLAPYAATGSYSVDLGHFFK